MELATTPLGYFKGNELRLHYNQGYLQFKRIAQSTEGIELAGVTYKLTVPPKHLFGVFPIGRKSVRKGYYAKAVLIGKMITFTHITDIYDDETVVVFDELNKITKVEGDRL
jgi:hypothetical protein